MPSGLVIAYSAETKDRSPGTYALNLLARLYSVVLPALVLAAGLERFSPLIVTGGTFATVALLASVTEAQKGTVRRLFPRVIGRAERPVF